MGIIPKIRFERGFEEKPKVFCVNCKIRLGVSWGNKGTEFSDGFYCSACSFNRLKNTKTNNNV